MSIFYRPTGASKERAACALDDSFRPALRLSVTDAASQLGGTRAALSRVQNERTAISPAMVLKIGGWLGVKRGGRTDLWVAQQATCDLWQARKTGAPKVRSAPPELEPA